MGKVEGMAAALFVRPYRHDTVCVCVCVCVCLCVYVCEVYVCVCVYVFTLVPTHHQGPA